MSNEEAAKRIIKENIYITLSTVSNEGEPWVSPVYFWHDEDYNFYWVSGRDRRHSQNMRDNGRVAMVIFDTHIQEGKGRGVYVQAKAHELGDEEAERFVRLFYPGGKEPQRNLQELLGVNGKMYRAVSEKIWVTDEASDDRVEVTLGRPVL